VVVILAILFSIYIKKPETQKYLTEKLTTYLNENIDSKVDIESIEIDFFKQIAIKDATVYDLNEDTLIYIQNAKVDIDYFNFWEKSFLLNEIKISDAKIKLYII